MKELGDPDLNPGTPFGGGALTFLGPQAPILSRLALQLVGGTSLPSRPRPRLAGRRCCSCAVLELSLDQSRPSKTEAGRAHAPSTGPLGVAEDHVESGLRGLRPSGPQALRVRCLRCFGISGSARDPASLPPCCALTSLFTNGSQVLLQTWPLWSTKYVCFGVWACPVSPQVAFAVAGLSGKLLDQDPSLWHWQLVVCRSSRVPFIVKTL